MTLADHHHEFDYVKNGMDWEDLCAKGLEQSPIDLLTEDVGISDMMELNGYGYEDFEASKKNFILPEFETEFESGEFKGTFILNLHSGKKQEFNPLQFELRAPSEHTIKGVHYDLELQILHQYKGTDG